VVMNDTQTFGGNLPQVAEANPPQQMDAAEEGLLYDESMTV